MTIKCHNLHSFKEGLVCLCQSILETRRISYLHASALFKIPLNREINFEKWEKVGFDHDENITIAYFAALEEVIITKT